MRMWHSTSHFNVLNQNLWVWDKTNRRKTVSLWRGCLKWDVRTPADKRMVTGWARVPWYGVVRFEWGEAGPLHSNVAQHEVWSPTG